MQEPLEEPEQTTGAAERPLRMTLGGTVHVGQAVEHGAKEKAREEGSLLDAALTNLNIAQQYVDETKHLVEHRLVCFHYAVVLMARFRGTMDEAKRKEMMGLARQCFAKAANWSFIPGPDAEKLADAHDRLVCESHYNLGVIDELSGCYQAALTNYRKSIFIAQCRDAESVRQRERRGRHYAGVEILARLGEISAAMHLLVDETSRTEIVGQIERLRRLIFTENASGAGMAPASKAFNTDLLYKESRRARSTDLAFRKGFGLFSRARGASNGAEEGSGEASMPQAQSGAALVQNAALTNILSRLEQFEAQLAAPSTQSPPG